MASTNGQSAVTPSQKLKLGVAFLLSFGIAMFGLGYHYLTTNPYYAIPLIIVGVIAVVAAMLVYIPNPPKWILQLQQYVELLAALYPLWQQYGSQLISLLGDLLKSGIPAKMEAQNARFAALEEALKRQNITVNTPQQAQPVQDQQQPSQTQAPP